MMNLFSEEESGIESCVKNICKNYGITAGLRTSVPLKHRDSLAAYGAYSVFLNINVGSCFDIHNQEILMQLAQDGIKSKKDYRKLRALIRMRMINAIRDIHDLAEDSLRNLGVK